MIKLKSLLIFLFFPLITSCATVATVAISGAGIGINYTLTNVAYRTFSFSLERVNQATTLALNKLNIKIKDNRKTEEGRTIKASTKELEIMIDLERVTSKCTKIKVNAKKGPILKDRATAAEIINQTGKILKG